MRRSNFLCFGYYSGHLKLKVPLPHVTLVSPGLAGSVAQGHAGGVGGEGGQCHAGSSGELGLPLPSPPGVSSCALARPVPAQHHGAGTLVQGQDGLPPLPPLAALPSPGRPWFTGEMRDRHKPCITS